MASAVPEDEGPDRWCYDAMASRTWSRDSWQLSLLRSLELVWIHFDGNPAVFANMVEGEQAIEDFLVGPPAAATPDDLLDEARAYIRGARTTGRSTWLALEIAPPHPRLWGTSWRIAGENPEGCGLPGPESAGVYGGTPASNRRGIRALVRPGPVDVIVHLNVATDATTHSPIVLAHTLDVARHVGTKLGVVFDSPSSPAARLVVSPL